MGRMESRINGAEEKDGAMGVRGVGSGKQLQWWGAHGTMAGHINIVQNDAWSGGGKARQDWGGKW